MGTADLEEEFAELAALLRNQRNRAYNEQAQSFATMANVGRATAASELDIANQTDTIAGQQRQIAAGQQQLAAETQQAANTQATGDFVGSLLKGAGRSHRCLSALKRLWLVRLQLAQSVIRPASADFIDVSVTCSGPARISPRF
jgi:ABC-type Fe3+-citrate transport system substrate-binding protein